MIANGRTGGLAPRTSGSVPFDLCSTCRYIPVGTTIVEFRADTGAVEADLSTAA